MNPLHDLESRFRRTFPKAKIDSANPASPGGVGFLDIDFQGTVLSIEWHEDRGFFGVSSPEGHGYGEKPDEIYWTAEEAEARIAQLLHAGGKTEPPEEVTLRELRAERKLPQTKLAALLGVSQPAISRVENNVPRMLVATLRAVIQAMGGTLELRAHFPDGAVRQIVLDDTSGQTTPDLIPARK